MKIIFFLKGAARLDWQVPEPVLKQPGGFNFQLLCKLIRADGYFIAEGVYVVASEISAMIVDHEKPLADEDDVPVLKHQRKVDRLVS